MDTELCVSKEQLREHSDRDCDLSQISFEKLDPNHGVKRQEFMGLLWEFFMKVNGEDTSHEMEIDHNGHTYKFVEVDVRFNALLDDKCGIQTAYNAGEMIGFLVYHLIYDCVLVVRHEYLDAKYIGQGLAKELLQSLKKPIKKVIFQTRKHRPPRELLAFTDKRRKKIFENGEMITWEMSWEV